MRSLFNPFIKVFSSLGLSVTLLILLSLLTWLGTLEQVDHGLFEVQKKYFESFFLVHEFGDPDVEGFHFKLPLPGANLVLCLLFVNLVVGGMIRMRRGASTAGILVVHVGIALLLVAGLVKMYFSEDGHVTLFEGQTADHFESYYRWEVVVTEELEDGSLREHLIPQEFFQAATGSERARVTSEALPFDLELNHFIKNSRPLPKGPMFEVEVPVLDGVFLDETPLAVEAEQNVAGLYFAAIGAGERTEGLLWGLERAPMTLEADGKRWGIGLRHEQYPMPFTLKLDEFTKVDHPRSTMPKWFSSDVTVIEGEAKRPIEISMNEPLRDRGLVLYQASWGPSNAAPGDPLFSTFSVVRNPADQYPLYACIVIAIGLLLHFTRKLLRFIRAEARTA